MATRRAAWSIRSPDFSVAIGAPGPTIHSREQAGRGRDDRRGNGREDGLTLLPATSADARNTTLYDNLKFNFARDITAVAPISRGPACTDLLSSSRRWYIPNK